MNEKKFDLEARLIRFAVSVIRLSESLPQTPVGNLRFIMFGTFICGGM